MALHRDAITASALELMDQEGLDRVSTRRLALRLGVEGPALYHHFRNKQDLLGEMVNALLIAAIRNVESATWQGWIEGMTLSIRAALAGHRDGARLIATAWPNQEMDAVILPRMTRPLLDAGFTRPGAETAILILSSLTIGWALNEQNEGVRRRLAGRLDPDLAFLAAVRTVIRGLEAEPDLPPATS